MRFASIPLPKAEQRSPAAEFVRKLLGADLPPVQTQQQPAPELPNDLDQRVRLVGEW